MKNTCPPQNQCQTANLIYRAYVENEVNNEKKMSFGLAATTFKEQFGTQATQQKCWVVEIYMTTERQEKVHGKTKVYCCPLCLVEKLHLIEYLDDIRL